MTRAQKLLAAAAAALVTITVLILVLAKDNEDPAVHKPNTGAPSKALQHLRDTYTFRTQPSPNRTSLVDRTNTVVAVLTTGARTVLLRGPQRTFTEPATTTAKIITNDWVRIAPKAFNGTVDNALADWLDKQLVNTADDLLADAQQYAPGAPLRHDDKGVAYAGDAGFGYERDGDSRDGADFYEYLGVPWTFPDGQATPDTRWSRHLDCSGFIRLIYGYRHGIPLFRGNAIVDGLPRSTWAMADHSPSAVIAATNSAKAPKDLSRLQAGDVVFFALHDDEPTTISHSGIYLGKDTDGHLRFVSSRETADGPTFGDMGGKGYFDAGRFGDTLRRIIRL